MYTQAIYHNPGNAGYYGNRSATLLMLEQYQRALEDAVTSIKLDESFLKGYLRAAKCHLMLGNPSLSIDYYHKVLERSPTNTQAKHEVRLDCSCGCVGGSDHQVMMLSFPLTSYHQNISLSLSLLLPSPLSPPSLSPTQSPLPLPSLPSWSVVGRWSSHSRGRRQSCRKRNTERPSSTWTAVWTQLHSVCCS